MVKNGTLHGPAGEFDYVRFGTGKQQLVLLSGLGDGLVTVKNKALFGAVAYRELGRHFTVTVISRRNDLQEDATTETMARDQAGAMLALGIHRACVVGVSQGGMIAQHLAADFPELVEKLALVVTIPRANTILTRNAGRWIDLAERGEFFRLMVDITEKSHPEPLLGKARRQYPLFRLMHPPKSYDRFFIQARACMTHDSGDKPERISCPTLVVGGALDETLGADGSQELYARIEGSRLLLYPDLGHALYEDAPDFSRQLIDFFTEA